MFEYSELLAASIEELEESFDWTDDPDFELLYPEPTWDEIDQLERAMLAQAGIED